MSDPHASRTALVAGGAGFVGYHLCRFLLMKGHRVVCVDDLSTGQQRNLDQLAAYPNFRFLRHDVEQPLDVACDEIWNLACPASPPKYQAVPLKTIRTCVLGSTNLLELARRNGAPILFTSTSEVYGDPQVIMQSEDYRGNVNCFGPRACYDEGKRLAETIHYEYRQRHGVDARVARLFNTYGPNMDPEDGRVVSNFVVQALRGEPMTVYGDGSQTRSLCYAEDTMRGLAAMMEGRLSVEEPVNIGNPYEMTVLEIAETIRGLVGTRSPIVRKPLPMDDPLSRCPNISRARRLLAWEPIVELRTGLERTIAYFRSHLDLRENEPRTVEARNAALSAAG